MKKKQTKKVKSNGDPIKFDLANVTWSSSNAPNIGTVTITYNDGEEVVRMTKKQFFNKIARKADTKRTKINVAVSYRVTKLVLDEMKSLSLRDLRKVLA